MIASELLAQAVFLEGKVPQSFPFFGVERRGAPVTAFTRIDDGPIRLRTSVTTPDIVVVLDASLMRTTNVSAGLKHGGILLVNAERVPDRLDLSFEGRLAVVDGTAIALERGLGSKVLPIVNTAVLGALSKVSGVVSLGSLEIAIERFVPAKREENRAAARAGFDRVSVREVVIA